MLQSAEVLRGVDQIQYALQTVFYLRLRLRDKRRSRSKSLSKSKSG